MGEVFLTRVLWVNCNSHCSPYSICLVSEQRVERTTASCRIKTALIFNQNIWINLPNPENVYYLFIRPSGCQTLVCCSLIHQIHHMSDPGSIINAKFSWRRMWHFNKWKWKIWLFDWILFLPDINPSLIQEEDHIRVSVWCQ